MQSRRALAASDQAASQRAVGSALPNNLSSCLMAYLCALVEKNYAMSSAAYPQVAGIGLAYTR